MLLSWFPEADASVERGCWRSRGSEGRKAASHHLGAGRRWSSPRKGEAGKSISLLLLLPPTKVRKKFKKIFFIFQLVQQLRTPPLPPTHTHRRGHTKTKGEVGEIKPPAQAHLSRMAWARGSPGPATSPPRNAKGRGWGFSRLPSLVRLSSNHAQPPPSPPTPLGQGTRTTCLQPPPPPLRGQADAGAR